MPAKKHRTIQHTPDNAENTAKLLQTVAKELYQKNIEIRKEEARLDDLLSRVAEVIFAVDQNYKITLFNSTAESVFGINELDAVGKHADEIIKIFHHKSDEQIKIEDYAFKNKLFTIQKVKVKIILTSSIKEKFYTLKSNYADFDDNEKEAIISLADITSEVEIERLKDDFISIASHELKTPLSIIRNNLWMLTNTTGMTIDDKRKRYISEINQGLDRLKRLVEELLNVSRIEQNRIIIDTKEYSADVLIDDSLDNFIETFNMKKINFIAPEKTNSQIMVDQMKFQEVLDNFISNAIKYANPESPQIKITTEVANEMLKISVNDNGPGIDASDYPKIFTKFGRATQGLKLVSPGASTGLGLYICKNYVEGMGGKIGFTSKVGEGSTFWFAVKIAGKK